MSNVLIIFADDMRKDMLKFMPFVNGVLRSEGTEFTNAFCNVPICQASRVAILTGQHALHNGIYHNEEQDEWLSGYEETIGSWVQAETVTTGAFGKMPNGYRQAAARPGWNTWKIFTGGEQESISYAMSTNGVGGIETPLVHHLDYVKGKVSEFCVDTVGDWFAWWNPSSPHITTSTLRNNPKPGSISKFDWYKWKFDLLTDAELAATTKPTWISGGTVWTKSDLAFMAEMASGQIKECYDLDQAIKALCDDLIADGTFDDTTVIFCSDGGVFFGEQRTGNLFASGKNAPYYPAANIPMIVRGPGFPAGRKCHTAVSLADVTATVVDVFGATPGITMDGVSLLDIKNTRNPTRPVLYERRQPGTPEVGDLVDAQGVFTQQYKLIRYVEDLVTPRANFTTNPTDEYELYDIAADPKEKVNLAYLGGIYLDIRNELEAQLDSILGEEGDLFLFEDGDQGLWEDSDEMEHG